MTISISPPPSQGQKEAKMGRADISTKQAEQQPVPPEPFSTLPSKIYLTIADFLPERDGVALKISNKGTYDDIDTTIQSMINTLKTRDIRTEKNINQI